MAGREMVRGGATAEVAASGGYVLARKLRLLLAGQRIDHGFYAVVQAAASVVTAAHESEAEALAFVDVMGGDIKKLIRLNFADWRAQLAQMASQLRDVDAGRAQ